MSVAAHVEADDLGRGAEAAIVEVGSGDRDVAQARHLERAAQIVAIGEIRARGAAQAQFVGSLNSARPRSSCASSSTLPARKWSYLLLNGANSTPPSFSYCCSACKAGVATRPSRLKPPVGVPAASKLKAGV